MHASSLSDHPTEDTPRSCCSHSSTTSHRRRDGRFAWRPPLHPAAPLFVSASPSSLSSARSLSWDTNHSDGPPPLTLGGSARLECAVCFGNDLNPLKMSLVPGCLHRVCRRCVRRFLRHRIADGLVTDRDLVCPCDVDCPSRLPVSFVRNHLSARSFERFLHLRLLQWEPEPCLAAGGRLEREVVVHCPVARCGNVFVVGENDSTLLCHRVTCDHCLTDLCIKCHAPAHGRQSCRAARAHRLQNIASGCSEEATACRQFLEEAERRDWQACPHCGTCVERVEGCDQVVCRSTHCRGRRAFCFNCGESCHGHVCLKSPKRSLPPAQKRRSWWRRLLPSCM